MRTVRILLPRAQDTHSLGVALARSLHPGDVLVLSGDLGAGKTTFTQGLGEGLGVRGPVTSPTFVIARTYPPRLPAGLALIHVDAYRLAGALELDDLDLDAEVAQSVTVVEWGSGLADRLSEERLGVTLTVDAATEARTAVLSLHLDPARADEVAATVLGLGGEPC